MTQQIFWALAAFAFVSSITPGPNNLMLMASGANFGFRRTIPHMLGVNLGFVILVILVGMGLSQVFQSYPAVHTALTVISVGYMGYLAYKIATSSAPAGSSAHATPLSFLQAALFQWVNPKAWAMALTAVSLYAPDNTPGAILLMALIFGLINFPSINVWVIMGMQVRRILSNPARLRLFNAAMAVLLLASLYPILAR